MYKHFRPSPILSECINSFWWAENTKEEAEKMIIIPDSFFKIILILKDEKVFRYYLADVLSVFDNESTPKLLEVFIAPYINKNSYLEYKKLILKEIKNLTLIPSLGAGHNQRIRAH